MIQIIYLDSASTTQVDKNLKELIDKYTYDLYGNPGGLHNFGMVTKGAIERAREQVATAVKTEPENIIFTSGGSESNTLAIVGLANHLQRHHQNHIITTQYEHHSVLNAMKEMEKRGFEVTYLPVQNGLVDYDDFVKAVRDDTGLVSIMCVNNELGTINDVEKICKFCQEREILFHSDCVQAVCTESIELGKTADFISISGHKIHAPKSVGCLCTTRKELLSNIIFGGQQEFGLRPGTENVAGIVAFGRAMENQSKNMYENRMKVELANLALGGKLLQLSEERGFWFDCNFPTVRKSPKILSLRFDGVDAQTLVLMLGERGVCVSAGSACSSHSTEPSHVLRASGLTSEQARRTIRISFSEYNTVFEAHEAAKIIADCVCELKNIK